MSRISINLLVRTHVLIESSVCKKFPYNKRKSKSFMVAKLENDSKVIDFPGTIMTNITWGPFAEGHNGLFQNETLKAIGEKHGKSIAQVVLRWLIQRRVVCIPKSVNLDRIEQNFDVFNFSLSEDDMQLIGTLDTGKSCFFSHEYSC